MDNQFQTGSISQVQNFLNAKLNQWGFADETLHERLLLLTEEVGELIHACRKISGMNNDQAREITKQAGEEIADILNLVFAVGIKLDLNIENEFLKVIDKVDQRTYKRADVNIN